MVQIALGSRQGTCFLIHRGHSQWWTPSSRKHQSTLVTIWLLEFSVSQILVTSGIVGRLVDEPIIFLKRNKGTHSKLRGIGRAVTVILNGYEILSKGILEFMRQGTNALYFNHLQIALHFCFSSTKLCTKHWPQILVSESFTFLELGASSRQIVELSFPIVHKRKAILFEPLQLFVRVILPARWVNKILANSLRKTAAQLFSCNAELRDDETLPSCSSYWFRCQKLGFFGLGLKWLLVTMPDMDENRSNTLDESTSRLASRVSSSTLRRLVAKEFVECHSIKKSWVRGLTQMACI